MWLALTPKQEQARAEFRAFTDSEIAPCADLYDREEQVPASLVARLATQGYLGATLPRAVGGRELDMLGYGLLHEEVGRASASVRSLLTAHDMVAHAVRRWGSAGQKAAWLPRLASGERIAAFALSEPNVGSDAARVETTAEPVTGGWVLDGHKMWITAGQIADVFLVLARCAGQPTAFLVERDVPGLAVEPITRLFGTRAAMLAELRLTGCRVGLEALLGRVGTGFSHVAAAALDHGRYSVAWGSVGIAQGCLEACLRYTSGREQFGQPLRDHQLVRRLITQMVTGVQAARLQACQAGHLRQIRDPRAIRETAIAKYLASVTATRIAADAVQIHGANGCSERYPVQRYLRDATVMEIIEGSTQIQEITIAEYAYEEYAASASAASEALAIPGGVA